ncbi:MAG: beta-mannosidase [Oscillospiraceae bacterium]|nr:beta-mannosidase [Oscillospiraceae bacterium]
MKNFKRLLSAVSAAALCGSLIGMMPGTVTAAGGLGTYEVETLEGADVWTSIYENQLPGYSGEGFAYLTASPISFEIEVEEEGMYQIDVRAAQILSGEGGSRMQTISVNGIDYTFNMPYTPEWTDMTFGVFRMKAGVNEIVLKPQYGYGAYDTITVSKAVLPELKGTATLSDPKATPETQALMNYLNSVYGKHVLTGQQEIYGGGHGVQTSIRYDASQDKCIDENGKEYTIVEGDYGEDEQGNKFPWHCVDEKGQDYVYNTQNRCYGYNNYNQECDYLYETTGHYPAIRGFDMNTHNPGFCWDDGVTDRMIKWATEQNGICTLSWHCTVPRQMADFEIDDEGNITKISDDWQQFTYDTKTDWVTANVMIEGTKENVFYNEAIRLVAAELKRCQDAGVPIIFRPLHEAEGNPGNNADGSGAWFWWSKEGAKVYNELWKYLYDKLTNEYGLHNLIWEQNLYAWSDESALWYTGDDYVDIVGFDKYNTQYNRHDGKTSGPNEDAESKIFWSQVGYVDNKKMVSMPENDSIPSVENMEVEQAYWLYFCTWYDGESGAPQFISGENYQNVDTLINTYQSDLCITLDELPKDLYGSGTTVPTEATETTETTETTAETLDTYAPEVAVYGDVDENGKVELLDVIQLNKNLLGMVELTDNGRTNADVNIDTKVTGDDSLLILKSLVSLVTLPAVTK